MAVKRRRVRVMVMERRRVGILGMKCIDVPNMPEFI